MSDADGREIISTDDSGELYRDETGMHFRKTNGEVVYIQHPQTWKGAEMVLGEPGDEVPVIPECPCLACDAARDVYRKRLTR